MTSRFPTRRAVMLAAASLCLVAAQAAEAADPPGVTATEIKIGQTMPYSGPASSYGTIGKVEQAYFEMLNEQGGVNGRKINLISLDDGYSPPKTVEQTRKLVEREGVLLIFDPLGTAPNSAIQKYLNSKKIPQLFISSGSSRFNDPKQFPWTMPWLPSYEAEGYDFGVYVLKNKPAAKIAILYQNDDIGKDYIHGVERALGDKAGKMIVAKASYEVTDPTVESQVVTLQGSGADTLISVATPKFAAQAIRKIHDIGWKPLHLTSDIGSSIGAVLKPAGVEKAVGMITGAYVRDPTDPATQATDGYKAWLAFMKKYYPEGDTTDLNNVIGYSIAQTLVQTLKQCGDDLSRENVMRQAANLHDLVLPMVMPGLVINTSPTDYQPLKSVRLMRFDGEHWVVIEEKS
ncbi:MAG: ABC transporter substrate-binding protein [Alphaproteobacteria bacterium]|nr:ABC transporter substrate-binding protein [Alphaproteobacteria bacterium]